MKKKKNRGTTVILIIIFFAGLSLLLYPTFANFINQMHSSKAIAEYSDLVEKMSREERERMFHEAEAYNQALAGSPVNYKLEDSQRAEYESLLNIDGTGVMGIVEIPSISVTLPVYHGTDDNTLQVAAGHIEWTSLPVGGLSSHCVLSGHRGLPSAKLFTDLDKVTVGDEFMLRVLDEVLTYEVDQIVIVLPQNTSELQIVPGEDYCTLVTCTPYGINSHRLLVRGHRIETKEVNNAIRVTADAMQVEPLVIAAVIAVPLLILLLIFVLGRPNSTKKKHRRKKGGL